MEPRPPKYYLLGSPVSDDIELQSQTKKKLLWTTYRKKIKGLDTDSGWGCTVRSLQMLLTNGFVKARHGDEGAKRAAASLIIDWDTSDAVFSLPRLMATSGSQPGKWFGPAEATALIIRSSPPPPRPSPGQSMVADGGLCTSPSSLRNAATVGAGGFAPKGATGAASSSSISSMATATATGNTAAADDEEASSSSSSSSSSSADVEEQRRQQEKASLASLRIILCNDATISKREVRAVASAITVAAAAELVSVSGPPSSTSSSSSSSPDKCEKGHAAASSSAPSSSPTSSEAPQQDGPTPSSSSSSWITTSSSSSSTSMPWRPVLAIVPLRLGLNEAQKEYLPLLAGVMRLGCFLGAVGGSPRHSVFFCGVTGPHLSSLKFLYLDPHTTQECPPAPVPQPVGTVAPAVSTVITSVSDMSGEAVVGGKRTPTAVEAKAPVELHASASTGSLAEANGADAAPTDTTTSNNGASGGPIFEGSVVVGGSVAASVPLYPRPEATAAVPDSFLASMTPPHGAPFSMKPSALDPTISLGFLFTTEEEFERFCEDVEALTASASAPAQGLATTASTGAAPPTRRVTKLFEIVEKRAALPFDEDGTLGDMLAFDGEDLDLDVDAAVNRPAANGGSGGGARADGGSGTSSAASSAASSRKNSFVGSGDGGAEGGASSAGGGGGFLSALKGMFGLFFPSSSSAVPEAAAKGDKGTSAAATGRKAKRRKESRDEAEEAAPSALATDALPPSPPSLPSDSTSAASAPGDPDCKQEVGIPSEAPASKPSPGAAKEDLPAEAGDVVPSASTAVEPPLPPESSSSTNPSSSYAPASSRGAPPATPVPAHRGSTVIITGSRDARGSFAVEYGSFSSPASSGSGHPVLPGLADNRSNRHSRTNSFASSSSSSAVLQELPSPFPVPASTPGNATGPNAVGASPVVVSGADFQLYPGMSPLPPTIGNAIMSARAGHARTFSAGSASSSSGSPPPPPSSLLHGVTPGGTIPLSMHHIGTPRTSSVVAAGASSPLLLAANAAMASGLLTSSASTGARRSPLIGSIQQHQQRTSPLQRPSFVIVEEGGVSGSPPLTASHRHTSASSQGTATGSTSNSSSHGNNEGPVGNDSSANREPEPLAI